MQQIQGGGGLWGKPQSSKIQILKDKEKFGKISFKDF